MATMGRPRVFSDEQAAEMVRLYKVKEQSISQIAAVFGCSRTTVSDKLKEGGVTFRPCSWHTSKLSSAEWAVIRRRWATGESLRSIAGDYDISVERIRQKMQSVIKGERTAMLCSRANGATYEELAVRFQVPVPLVWKICSDIQPPNMQASREGIS